METVPQTVVYCTIAAAFSEARNVKILGPGFAIDEQNGILHVSIPSILDDLGVTDTPANREICFELVQKELRKICPDAPQIVLQ